jgi:hypothetical protein
MQLNFLPNDSYRIDLTEGESLLTNNTFNEALYGIKIPLFEDSLGIDKPTAIQSFESFDLAEKVITCNLKEINFLKNATLFVIRDFILPEFHPRLGVDLEEVLDYLADIIEIIEKVRLASE